eukprot:g4960.t1
MAWRQEGPFKQLEGFPVTSLGKLERCDLMLLLCIFLPRPPSMATAIDAVVLIDTGTSTTKAGCGGEDLPRCIAPTERKEHLGKLVLSQGRVASWDELEKLWRDTYHQLRLLPHQHPVLLTDAPLTPKEDRERITQIMFESFNVPAMYLACTGALSLYAAGRTTGIALELGHGSSCAMPVYEGQNLQDYAKRSDVAGKQVTESLARMLATRGIAFGMEQRDIVRDIKEKVCSVVLDQASLRADVGRHFELPDGAVVSLGDEIHRGPELLFKPQAFGTRSLGIHEITWQSLQSLDLDVRQELSSNVVLSGGTSLLPQLPQRLTRELEQLMPELPVKVVANHERKYGVYLGASILSSLGTFQQNLISSADYEEMGPCIVHRRCSTAPNRPPAAAQDAKLAQEVAELLGIGVEQELTPLIGGRSLVVLIRYCERLAR